MLLHWHTFLWRQHSGAPLRDHFVRRPSVCLSVCHTFGLLITFLPSEVGLSYLACVFLMTTPFRWYHRFWARDLDCDLWPTFGKFRLSHFWFAYNFFTFRGRAFIFAMWVPYDNTFPIVPSILSTWQAECHLEITFSRLYVCLSVRLSHFWFAYNFFTFRGRAFIFCAIIHFRYLIKK